jgi:hypothetical protein
MHSNLTVAVVFVNRFFVPFFPKNAYQIPAKRETADLAELRD